MPRARHRIACLIVVAALVAPQAAWAQGAGDEQYQDPFAGGNGQSDDQGTSGGGSESAQATPTPAPVAPSQTPAPTSAPAPAVAASQQLPRTGNDPITVAVAGFWVLLGGVALRARVRPR